MRVLLSGTSNSILAKGINFTLGRDPAISGFTNQSYGASGSVALGDHLEQIDFAAHDFCVLDYCVNEDMLIREGDSTPDAGVNNLLAAIDAASRAGCQPIVVLFPMMTDPASDSPFAAKVQAVLGGRVPVFDGYRFATRMADVTGTLFEDLFLDPRHMRREVGQFIGTTLIGHMKEAGGVHVDRSDLTHQPLGFLPAKSIAVTGASAFVTRETKLTRAELLSLQPRSRITLPCAQVMDGPCEVIGLTCNAARSTGQLNAAETGAPIGTVNTGPLFAQTRGLTMVGLPLRNPLSVESDAVEILYDYNGKTTDLQPNPALELGGFVLRPVDQPRPVHIATSVPMPVALEDHVTDSDLKALGAVLAATPAA